MEVNATAPVGTEPPPAPGELVTVAVQDTMRPTIWLDGVHARLVEVIGRPDDVLLTDDMLLNEDVLVSDDVVVDSPLPRR